MSSARVVKLDEERATVEHQDGSKEDILLSRLYGVWLCGACSNSEPPIPLGFPCSVGHLPFDLDESELGAAFLGTDDFDRKRIAIPLCGMIADALGAPVEGWSREMILQRFGKCGVERMCAGTQMGIREEGLRWGMYTDDTNSALALLTALAEKNGEIDANFIAQMYATFYFQHSPKRGYPDSAIKVLKAVQEGTLTIDETAVMCFADGSFANGGAMRIGPLALFFPPETNYKSCFEATVECVRSSHVHPDAVESAALLAWANFYILNNLGAEKSVENLFSELLSNAKQPEIRKRLEFLCENRYSDDDFLVLSQITDYRFQIYAPDALATAVWFFVKYFSLSPRVAIQKCVSFGGDTDTTGAMCGYLVGAHSGTSWIPHAWFDALENDEFGRDYLIRMVSVNKLK